MDELVKEVQPVPDGKTVDQQAELKKAIETEFLAIVQDLKIGQYGAVAIEVYTNKLIQILSGK